MPGGQITFDVDLRRPITDDLEPAEQEQNLGVCRDREFTLPSAYEARYTNYPNVCLARYRHDMHCAHGIAGICSLVICKPFVHFVLLVLSHGLLSLCILLCSHDYY